MPVSRIIGGRGAFGHLFLYKYYCDLQSRTMCKRDERTHRHHIIPRYMGGTDSAENLVEVNVTQHAMFHFCNYNLWKNEEDKIAWLALSGQISIDDAKIQSQKIGSKKGIEAFAKLCENPEYKNNFIEKCRKSFHNSPHKERILKQLKNNHLKAIESAKNSESKRKRKQTLSNIKHQQGEKNSQYGKMWITNGTKSGTYKINKGEQIPQGFWKGRVCFDVRPSGENASAYGKMWINNGSKNKMILKNQPIPDGYKKGRIYIKK